MTCPPIKPEDVTTEAARRELEYLVGLQTELDIAKDEVKRLTVARSQELRRLYHYGQGINHNKLSSIIGVHNTTVRKAVMGHD